MLSEMSKMSEKCMDIHTDWRAQESPAPAVWGERLNWAELKFPAVAENVALARAFIVGIITVGENPAWEVTVSSLDEIKVAVSEAVSNAIIHGYGRDKTKVVSLYVEQFDRAIRVRVEDCGVGIADIARARQPDFTTGQEHLGLGFAFMESFTDELSVQSDLGRGTVVTLVKLFGSSLAAKV